MENKLNREGIKNYSVRFAKKALEDFFNSNDKINGNQILNVQEIKQINLFVIKNLFREWQNETVRLKSPFFDYENDQVKEALTNFMNVLSRNISIAKDTFYDLFIQATEEAILLIFSPYDFYTHIVERNNKAINRMDLDRIAKYVKVNENIINLLIEKMKATGVDELNAKNLPGLMDKVFANIEDGPEDIEIYLKAFTEVLTLQVSDLYLDEGNADASGAEEVPKEVDDNEKQEGAFAFEWAEEPQKTLHEELSDSPKTTLAEIHEQQKIESIRDSLSINQRFMFINILFEGYEEKFTKALEDLDGLDGFYAATSYIKENFPSWDFDSEEVQEFIEVLEKRY